MSLLQPMAQGLDGAQIDGSWFLDVLAFVRATPWLHGPMVALSDYGVALFVVPMLAAWWIARRADAAAMAAVLWTPVAPVLAFLVNGAVKNVFTEPRPCRSIPNVHTLLPCDPPTDWAFPSNHSAVAAAAAVALLLVHRKIGIAAVVWALLIGFSRVYVGAHYPHDVVVGLVMGTVVGLVGIWARRALALLVSWLRGGPLAVLVTAGPVAVAGVAATDVVAGPVPVEPASAEPTASDQVADEPAGVEPAGVEPASAQGVPAKEAEPAPAE